MQITCVSCGAKYDKNKIRCPYCYTENHIAAKKEKKQILAGYDKEADDIREDMKNYPKRTAKKWTGYLVKGLVILFILGILVTVGIFVYGKRSAGKEYNQKQKQVEILEGFLQDKDYDGLADYISEYELYDNCFDPYLQIRSVYWDYEYLEDLADDLDNVKEYTSLGREEQVSILYNWSVSTVNQGYWVLNKCRDYIEDMAILGNEEILQDLYEDCEQILMNVGLTKEDVMELSTCEEEQARTVYAEKVQAYFVTEIP